MSQQGMEFQQSAGKNGSKYEPIWLKHFFFGRIHTLSLYLSIGVVAIEIKPRFKAQRCQRSKTVFPLGSFQTLSCKFDYVH